MKIVFVTNNQHKLDEIKNILGQEFNIVSLNDIGCHDDIPETGDTLEENASQKSNYIASRYALDCFADDTGLEVDALGGQPGVHSARYAEETDHDKLLDKLGNNNNRKARFRTVISLIVHGKEHRFEGIVEGRIAHQPSGVRGFGYDPVFIPDGYDKSFAELGDEVKNQISHRARAVRKLAEHIKQQHV